MALRHRHAALRHSTRFGRMRAAIYCRISLDQTGEALGVTRQLEDCRALVEAQQGWAVTEVYTDNDISASSGKPRPEYRRMLKAIEHGEVDVIVAWAPDRIYRRLADLEELIAIVDKRNVAIRTVKAGEFDLSTGMGKMLARILGSVAQGEGDIKAERWKRSIRQRREAGTPHKMGPRLYGYERDGTIKPDEQEHILWAAGQMLDGAALIRVTINLNERGSRTTMGNEWCIASVRKLLTNPRLAGMSTLNGDVVGVGQWKPILDAETFEALQTAMLARKGTVPRRPRVALLLGLVKCGKCGWPLKSSRRTKVRDETEGRRTYRCLRVPGVSDGCGGILVDAEAVEQIVEAYAKERAGDPRVQAYIEELSARSGERASEAIALETRIRELEEQLGEPGVPVKAILRAIDRSKATLEELRATAVEPSHLTLPGIDWPTDLARRARAVRNVVAEVIIDPAERGWVFDPTRVRIVPRT